MSAEEWEKLDAVLKREWISEAMPILGTAGALAHGKRLALESGMPAEEWEKLDAVLKREWISEAMSTLGSTADALANAKRLQSGVTEGQWERMNTSCNNTGCRGHRQPPARAALPPEYKIS
jgi:hypothetical protein